MEQYDIPWLRSPSPHHPHPNPHALRRFAHENKRGRELEGPYALPHTKLFHSFCRQVLDEFELDGQVQAAAVEHLALAGSARRSVQLQLSDGSEIEAGRLVVATGTGTSIRPTWVNRIQDPFPSYALQHSQDVNLGLCGGVQGLHILIVGGGLTSAHLAVGAIRRGARVSLLCRRGLRSKPFDADPGWLGPKYLKAFQHERCWQKRKQEVLKARDGGSITPELTQALRKEMAQGRLQLHEHCEVESARWESQDWSLVCSTGQALRANRIWLATGHHLAVSHHPLLSQLQKQRPIQLVDDWPVLGDSLQWPGTPVHVMGGLAALQVGPAARNLFGGREAAQRICRGLIKA
jgi:cation diffusion facilitator CzcD-associated flavoprotein CzcO